MALSVESIEIFIEMATKWNLRYLALIPRLPHAYSARFLPSPFGCYISDDAMSILFNFIGSGVSKLELFLKEAVNSAVVGPASFYIDRSSAARTRYNYLVCMGRIAALRMYDDRQLLPLSYFVEDTDGIIQE